MEFSELIQTRRSIRKYKDIPVGTDIIDKILQAGLMAPASKRSNPWEFIVTEDREKLAKLANARAYGSKLIDGAAFGIVVAADTLKTDVWIEDSAIAATFMQLRAHDLGVAGCWVQIRERFRTENQSSELYIREILGIPGHYAILCVLAFGYADEVKSPHNNDELNYFKIHREKFEL